VSFFDYLGDPDERLFLGRALDGSLDDDARHLYASRLSEKDPERAEWLRLECALHARATVDAGARARFDHLCETNNHDWVGLLRRDLVLNCGLARDEAPRVRFALVCDRHWESLEPTDDPGVRHCGECNQSVHFSDSAKVAEAHAAAGHCIAVPRTLHDGGVSLDVRHVLGRPDPIGDWARRLFPEGGSRGSR